MVSDSESDTRTPHEQTIYEELGVPTVINATGTKTRISGTLMRPEAVEAMADAADAFVRISDLQARASKLICEVTGAEAGYVASGASASFALAAAACIAGDDLGTMARLPNTEGVADEIIMPRTHRNGYDHALRLSGATIVDVGTNDHHLGTGSENVEPWEIADAITDETAGVAYMEKPFTTPPLEVVTDIAHEHDVPVIVDAAAELPPTDNLKRFIKEGADLVAFSGGKAVRGPQASGFLAGRRSLINSVALQHLDMHAAFDAWEPPAELVDIDAIAGVPRQGIGRSMKVGKEELVGLIRALQLFVDEDIEQVLTDCDERATMIADKLSEVDGTSVELLKGKKTDTITQVHVELAAGAERVTHLVSDLRRENPRVYVGADNINQGVFTINPYCLTDEEATYLVELLRSKIE